MKMNKDALAYEVYVDDNYENFSCDGGNGQALHGSYGTLEEAVRECKKIIDESLAGTCTPGRSEEDILRSWRFGGTTAFIRGSSAFSAQEYVEKRIKEMHGTETALE